MKPASPGSYGKIAVETQRERILTLTQTQYHGRERESVIRPVHGRQQLRSMASGTLLVPRARTATGQRSFAINGPRT